MIERALCEALLERLFPINRSLTGPGVRQTLEVLSEVVGLTLHEVPSGTVCYDWTVPPEWSIRDGWIRSEGGDTIVSYRESNLHVVGYSVPVSGYFSYDDLVPHLHTLPARPEAIPYRTSYYRRDWGFCLSHSAFLRLDPQATYQVLIDSTLDPSGSLTMADAHLKGSTGREYILSTYCCHPSLANDNLSGLICSVLLFRRLAALPAVQHSYRLIVVPETIGAIAYLYRFRDIMKQVDGGYVITTTAGPDRPGYKESYLGNHEVDVAARLALGDDHIPYSFAPSGSDERQFGSPGFRIPTGTITRSKYYEYQQYHTSEDDLSFISVDRLLQSLDTYWRAIGFLEANVTYFRREDHCEFQLGKYGLYPDVGGLLHQGFGDRTTVGTAWPVDFDQDQLTEAFAWLMHACDGDTSLLDIGQRSGLSPRLLAYAAEQMQMNELLDAT
jgi:aminopeptidase-like protein